MKLTCPECEASFSVPDGAITAEGRKVKCSQCKHMWIAVNREEEKEEAQVDSANAPAGEANDKTSLDMESLEAIAKLLEKTEDSEEESSEAPAEKVEKTAKKKKAAPHPSDKLVKQLLVASVVLMVLLAPFAFRSHLYSTFSPLYHAFGMVTSEQMVLQHVTFQKIPDSKRDRYAVSGEIVNEGKEALPLPTLRISLLDESGEAFFSREYEEAQLLEAGAVYPFRVGRIETAFKGRAKKMLVEVGNAFELGGR